MTFMLGIIIFCALPALALAVAQDREDRRNAR